MVPLSKTIFKAYDIRGVLGSTLDAGIAKKIGQAFGAAALAKGERKVVIGRDGRLSGPELAASLAEGLREAGVDVIDLGMVATPMVYFATNVLDAHSGIMVTGSHNPPDYNGFKMVLAGEAIYGDAIQGLYQAIERGFTPAPSQGGYSTHDIRDAYIQRIAQDVKIARPIKIAVDAGNGVAGAFVGDLYRAMGCEVTELFCEVDGHFPNHHPDPAHPENLEDLIAAVKNGDAELGLAFDGDGDRLGVVTKDGQIIFPDRQMMLFSADVLSRKPVDRAARRPSADVEDRPLAGQGQAEGNRRPAGRRDERPHLLEGPLVRLRRRPLHRRAPARDPDPRKRSLGRAERAAEGQQHAGTASAPAGRREFRAHRKAPHGR
jgi:phosphomannomutase/phosphoglucomutase